MTRIDEILKGLKEFAEQKKVPSSDTLLVYAENLNILLLDELDTLVDMEQELAKLKKAILDKQVSEGGKRNVSAAEIEVESTDIFAMKQKLENKIDRVKEEILIIKKRAGNGY